MSDVSGFLTSEQKPERPSVSRRFGEVLAVTAAGKADIELAVSGITIPGVPCMGSYVPVAGDSVVVDFTDDTPLVIGSASDQWHYVGAAGEPAFANSWVNYATNNYTNARFRKVGGIVYVQGMVKNGTINAPIFTLPVGYRPTGASGSGASAQEALLFDAQSNGALGRVDVWVDGTVRPVVGNNAWVSLNIPPFPADA